MIKYKLKCKSRFCVNEKEFDGWFQSFEAYENQKLKNLINCPICGSDNVVKLFSLTKLRLRIVNKDDKKAENNAMVIPIKCCNSALYIIITPMIVMHPKKIS